MEKLSQILWRERGLLEALHYRLEMEQLVLGSGRTRWLARSAHEVEQLLEVLRETEIVRAVAADEVAASIGLSHNPSLRALAEAVEEPWRSIMYDHRDAFLNLTGEISALAETNRGLLATGLRSTREALLSIAEESHGYSPDGEVVTSRSARPLVDRSL
jgi:hypothetical protein